MSPCPLPLHVRRPMLSSTAVADTVGLGVVSLETTSAVQRLQMMCAITAVPRLSMQRTVCGLGCFNKCRLHTVCGNETSSN